MVRFSLPGSSCNAGTRVKISLLAYLARKMLPPCGRACQTASQVLGASLSSSLATHRTFRFSSMISTYPVMLSSLDDHRVEGMLSSMRHGQEEQVLPAQFGLGPLACQTGSRTSQRSTPSLSTSHHVPDSVTGAVRQKMIFAPNCRRRELFAVLKIWPKAEGLVKSF